MESEWQSWLERGRVLVDAPPLSRADKSKRGPEDAKWALGDLMLEIPDHRVEAYARELGEERASTLRQYREVASRWPRERRVAASWTAHRELKDHPDRFALIVPGMTMRAAAEAAGKRPIDSIPPERMSLDERASHVVTLLMDKSVNDRVQELLEERRAARRLRRAARTASDERSGEYKEAMANLRDAQAAKSPETAFLEVVFQIQKAAEYVRAVRAAAEESDTQNPLVPEHRRPDLIFALEGLALAGQDALGALAVDRSGVGAPDDVIDVVVVERSRTAALLEPDNDPGSDQ